MVAVRNTNILGYSEGWLARSGEPGWAFSLHPNAEVGSFLFSPQTLKRMWGDKS